jgi:hypothetical protein
MGCTVDVALLTLSGLVCYSDLILTTRSWVYDDEMNFVDPPMSSRLSKLTKDNIQWAFQDGTVVGVYEPMALLAKMASAEVLGNLSANTIVLVNLVLHIVNSGLACALSRRVLAFQGGSTKNSTFDVSLLATLAVACSPLRAEVVCWSSCQPFLLACFFCQISWWCKLRGGLSWLGISLVAYSIACFCKAASISLPGLFFAFDFFNTLRRANSVNSPDRSASAPSLPSIVGTAIAKALYTNSLFVLVAIPSFSCIYQATLVQEASVRTLSPVELLLRACYSLCYYPQKSLIPTQLTVRVDLPDETLNLLSWQFGPPTLVVVMATASLAIAVLVDVSATPNNSRDKAAKANVATRASHGDSARASGQHQAAVVPLLWRTSYYWCSYCLLLLPTLGLVSTHVWSLAADR